MNITHQTLKILTTAFLINFLAAGNLSAQEFNCEVNVNDRQISGSSFEYVSELKGALEAYINNNRWTDDRYEEIERIRCQIQIVLTSADDQYNYSAEVFFSIRRPIYNTLQESSAIILSDSNWRFSYPRNKNLIRDDNQFDDLTSLIDFYLYVILGYDYDSFSELGGSGFFSRAQDVFEIAQNSNAPGWGRSIGAQRNRYGLINDLMSPTYSDLRRAIYRYHRHGLDLFTMDMDQSIEEVMDAIRMIRDNKRVASNNYLFDIFFDTKYNEIVALLSTADVQTRLDAYNLLRDVDPSHTSAYERLQN